MSIRFVLRGCWVALLLASALLPARRLVAQTSTGSIRGVVSDSSGAPLTGAQAVALNPSTGVSRTATTNARGFYALTGLTPASYQLTIRSIGHTPAQRQVQLQVGQVLTLDFSLAPTTVQLAEIVTTAAAPVAEVRSTENATNVTQEQIQSLPTSSRNFLDLAQLAPGVRVTPDRINGTGKTFASGALPADNINVFIDGQSYKNDITIGGVAAQDASRGNPFPRNAVQEFRVVTNNYKAEYQKASSAIITAVTKSGGNEWHGSLFTGYQNKGLVALDTFQLSDKEANPGTFEKPDYSRVLTGASAGGPLVRDKLFIFGAYEGNYQNRQGVTRFNGDPSTWPANVAALEGEAHTSPFRSTLAFAKLSYNHSENQLFELSGNVRHETDKRRFGGQFGDVFRSFSAGETFRNNVVDAGLKHTFFGRAWTNEGLVSFQWYQFNPEPFDFTDVGLDFNGIGRIGGADSRQDLTQRRLSFRDDWTYSGLQAGGAHVIKIGGNLDFVKYKLNKQLNENPVFSFNNTNNFATPFQAQLGIGDPEIDGNNTQLGIYAQDDWSPNDALTINAGIRWDYESGMYDRDYVTPPQLIDTLTQLRSQLFIDIDPARFFTDGTQRKAYTGAFQPRVGVSYAFDPEKNTVIFASGGIFYDRFGFNSFIDETYRRQHPNLFFTFSDTARPGAITWDPAFLSREGLLNLVASGVSPKQEVFLVPNDLKPPKSYQFSAGVRRQFGTVVGALSYSGIRGRNGFSYEWANVALNPDINDCCISIDTPYQNILVGNNTVRTWYDGVEARIDRSYRKSSERFGWGAGIAYTLSWAYAEGGDLFSFPTITANFNAKHPIADDQRHRIVVNWVADMPFAFGIQFSGLATFASGKPFKSVKLSTGPSDQRVVLGYDRTPWFKDVDLRLRKDFPNFGGTHLGITGDLFNIFNTQNLGCFDETAFNGDGTANANFGNGSCTISDPRRFQLGFQYDF
ncbi:MAG TPA: TonB-dependent receptor [Gemmatimonadales bacterium]|jgi:outer membrane receptor protein involved in Fe transport